MGFIVIQLTVLQRQKYQMERTNGKISKQIGIRLHPHATTNTYTEIGLRWIFEALSNGDLSDIPVSWFSDDDSELPEKREAAIKPVFETLKGRLSEKDHILVGHNLFTDLLFLYKTFFGPLPDKVTDFQELIHCLFPTVFDTKYIDTEGDHNSMSGRGGLKEILKPFLKVHTPLILLHEEHTSYGSSMGKDHEAGFDSKFAQTSPHTNSLTRSRLDDSRAICQAHLKARCRSKASPTRPR